MENLEKLSAGKLFKIVQYANGDELLFYEPSNRSYFQNLVKRHLRSVCEVEKVELNPASLTLIVRFHDYSNVPEKYRERLHLPLSNLFNSYAKAINRRYNRRGSVFTTRFERTELNEFQNEASI